VGSATSTSFLKLYFCSCEWWIETSLISCCIVCYGYINIFRAWNELQININQTQKNVPLNVKGFTSKTFNLQHLCLMYWKLLSLMSEKDLDGFSVVWFWTVLCCVGNDQLCQHAEWAFKILKITQDGLRA
jgi:hypothetical protein